MTLRKAVFWTHLVVGVVLGLVILSMCVTGTMLAFEPQLTARSERHAQFITPPQDGAKRMLIPALIQRAKETSPEGSPSTISFKSRPNTSVMVGFGKKKLLYLDPYTGRVLGEGSKTRVFLRSIEDWHKHIGAGEIGESIVCVGAIAFFLLGLSGIYLWWPRRAFTLRGQGRARDWNWHNTFGAASSAFVLVITTTGFLMASGLLKRPAPPKNADAEAPIILDLETLFAETQAKSSEWKTIILRIPQKSNEAPKAFVQPPPGGRTFRDWVKPVHTGQAWGIPGQLVNFLVALAGIVQIWTGFALAWHRFVSKSKRAL